MQDSQGQPQRGNPRAWNLKLIMLWCKLNRLGKYPETTHGYISGQVMSSPWPPFHTEGQIESPKLIAFPAFDETFWKPSFRQRQPLGGHWEMHQNQPYSNASPWVSGWLGTIVSTAGGGLACYPKTPHIHLHPSHNHHQTARNPRRCIATKLVPIHRLAFLFPLS